MDNKKIIEKIKSIIKNIQGQFFFFFGGGEK